jgi:integrase
VAKGNKSGHRRFGNIRKLPSGRYQASYLGPDGQRRYAPETYERKGDAERALVLIESQMTSGSWTDPKNGKAKLGDYATTWITERAGLRPRTVDLYQWLLGKHIVPYVGGVQVGKMSPALVREWRAKLLENGVSVSVAAKAYRLLRAIMTTAVEDDGILSKNPCRIKGAGEENAPERPVLTVAQVFELADRVGMRPVGNIRKTPGGYRLRFARNGVMRTAPEQYATRKAAEAVLWKMARDGRADTTQDGRYRALVLLATFASLRWGEVTALTRADLDLKARTVHIRAAFVQRSTGPLVIGPPKSQAGIRAVGIPAVIAPDLERHLAKYVKDEPGALVFTGPKGAPFRRNNFRKLTGWAHAVEALGIPGLHFHDLRHTGNQFAANSGVRIRDLMARMGHDSERAAMIYQHKARGADKAITDAIDAHVDDERRDDDGDDGTTGALAPTG